MKKVSIVVPVFNGEKTIRDCALSLVNQNFSKNNYEMLVIDNGSTDITFRILQKFKGKIRIFKELKRGPSHARNLGIRYAQGKIILFIDSDCIADRHWIKNMISPFKSKRIKMVGGQIKTAEKKNLVQKYCDVFCHTQKEYSEANIPFFASANAAVRKKDILKAGYFNPRFMTCDDLELCTRLLKNKNELYYMENAIVYHYYPPSLSYFLRKSYINGKYIGILTKKIKSKLFVKRLNYFNLIKKYGLSFMLLKLFQDITFRYGFIRGFFLKKHTIFKYM